MFMIGRNNGINDFIWIQFRVYRGLPEARGQSEAYGNPNLYNTIVGVP